MNLRNFDFINFYNKLIHKNDKNRKTNKVVKVGAFISIPKCASKTILEMYELGKNRADDNEDPNHNIIYENHQRLCVLENKYNLNNKFIFTFVRNPYDRVVSWFNYCTDINVPLYQKYTLNEWVKDGCKTHWKVVNSTDWEKEKKSPLLQYNFIEGKTNIDYIGKIENFENDNREIIKSLNNLLRINNINKKITHKPIRINTSNGNNEILTKESKEIIYSLFKKDFKYFDYPK